MSNCCRKPCRLKVLVEFVDSSFVERPLFNEFLDLRAINDAYLELLKSMKIDRLVKVNFLFFSLSVNGFPRPKN